MLCSAAADALLTLNGLDRTEVERTAFDAVRLFPAAGEPVPEPLADHMRVRGVSVDVWNGGVGLYVKRRGHELDGDDAALERVGAPNAAGGLRMWVSRYGADARSPDAKHRERAVGRATLGPFGEEKAQRAVIAGADDLYVLLARHALRHKAVYQAADARLKALRAAEGLQGDR